MTSEELDRRLAKALARFRRRVKAAIRAKYQVRRVRVREHWRRVKPKG